MNKITKRSLDNIVRRIQSFICVEYNKFGESNAQKVTDYLLAIHLINKEFKTNYSIKPKSYKIIQLPLED